MPKKVSKLEGSILPLSVSTFIEVELQIPLQYKPELRHYRVINIQTAKNGLIFNGGGCHM